METGQYLPDFAYLLYDFSPEGETAIRGGAPLRIILEMLRSVFYKDLMSVMASFKEAVMVIEQLESGEAGEEQKYHDLFKIMVLYIISARQDIEVADIRNAAGEISPERGEIVMTLAERLVNEGLEKGLEKGTEKVALQMLAENEDEEKIMRYTNLSLEKLQELKKHKELKKQDLQ